MEECENVIQCAWSSLTVGVPLFQVCEKIRATQVALLDWQRSVLGSTKQEIALVREKLASCLSNPF